MKLTTTMRHDIINRAIAKFIEPEKTQLEKRENELGILCYNAVYSEKDRRAAKRMPDGWLRMDSCLRFNVGGMSVLFNVKKSLPVKYTGSCGRLGDIADDKIVKLVQNFYDDKEKLKNNSNELRSKLTSMLFSILTFKKLIEVWPEGKTFYQHLKPKDDKATLPAILTSEINSALGLKL